LFGKYKMSRAIAYRPPVAPKAIKFFHIWRLPDEHPAAIIHNKNDQISQVVFNSGPEFAYERTCGEPARLEAAVDACNVNDIPIIFLTATYTYNKHLLNWDEDRYKNVTVIDWPAYWLSRMACMIDTHPESYAQNCSLGNDIRDVNTGLNSNIDYLYITFVNQPKPWRCHLMDLLAKANLIHRGAIAWRDVMRHFDSTRTDIVNESTYDWKYWVPKKMTLTSNDNFDHSSPDWWILPAHYSHAFMQIVPECSDEVFLISEKTAVPLLFNKLFLVVGPKNYHANVKDMGFKLYDKIFDYSFDSEDDSELRYEGLVQNVNKYRDKSMQELEQLIQSVKDKISYNRTHALKLARTMPVEWAKLVDQSWAEVNDEYLTSIVINNLTAC